MRLLLTDREVDLQTLQVEPGGRLTRLEGQLLAFLAEHPRRSFSTADLLREVWGYRTTRSNTVKSTVGRLRNKIEADPKAPVHLLHVRGVGYRFEPAEVREGTPVAVIGRHAELARLREQLERPGVVSLVGPPGSGRSHLAQALAHERRGHLVRLHGRSTADALRAALEQALQCTPRRLRRALQSSPLLVLLGAGALRGTLREQLPSWEGARVLVVGQRALDLPGERVVRLELLERDERRVYLAQRADELGQALDDAALDALADASEGLPLELELLVRHLPLGVPALLRDPGLVQGDALARVLAGAFSELARAQQQALLVLACFRGAFRLTWAAEVGDLAPGEVLQVRSWLSPVRPGVMRMPAVIRRFLQPRVPEALEARHRAWLVDRAGVLELEVLGPASSRAVEDQALLEHDLDAAGLLPSLASHLARERRHDERLALVRRADTPEMRAHAGEALRNLGRRDEAAALVADSDEPLALRLRGTLAWERGDLETALARYGEALERVEHPTMRVRLHGNLFQLARRLGRHELAEQHAGRALAAVQLGVPDAVRAFLLYARGNEALDAGRTDEALHQLGLAREAAERAGKLHYRCTVALALAAAQVELGDDPAATLDEAISLADQLGHEVFTAVAVRIRGVRAALAGDPELARTCFDEARRLLTTAGHKSELAVALCFLAAVTPRTRRLLARAEALTPSCRELLDVHAGRTPDTTSWDARLLARIL